MVVKKAFGCLKNRFCLLLTTQKDSPVQAWNNTFACMVLHNILNQPCSLYLQGWDNQTAGEALYDKVPGTDDAQAKGVQARTQTMSVLRDQIQADLCT
jgi:hypothetical protein